MSYTEVTDPIPVTAVVALPSQVVASVQVGASVARTEVVETQPAPVTVVGGVGGGPGEPGPAGPKGDPGPAGQPRFSGEGPPGLIIGASPNDEYLDTVTGDIYRLI